MNHLRFPVVKLASVFLFLNLRQLASVSGYLGNKPRLAKYDEHFSLQFDEQLMTVRVWIGSVQLVPH